MSVVGMGREHLAGALQGGLRAVDLEARRNQANEQLKSAEKAQTMQSTAMGAGIGMMAGAGSAAMGAQFGAAAGPIGMAAGAVLGFLFGELF